MDSTIPLARDRRPLAVSVFLRAIARRVFGRGAPRQVVDWKDTIAELLARALVGLVVGGASCLLLVPVVFWPGRRGRPSLYEVWGEPDRIAWVFIVPLAGAILFIDPRTSG
jgi:hypothetical protein